MYALVNEVSDLKRKSFYNQRLLKVPKNNLMRHSNHLSRSGGAFNEHVSTNYDSSMAANARASSQAPLAELNEGIILQSLDKKRTYYNSILSDIKP